MNKIKYILGLLLVSIVALAATDRVLDTTTLIFKEASPGTNKVTVQPPSFATDYTLTLPTTDGGAGEAIVSDGNGALSWSPVATLPLDLGTDVTGLTAGSLLFGSATGTVAEDNTNLFWDNTNNRLGIGVGANETTVTLGGTTYGSTLSVHAEGATDVAEVSVHRHSNAAALGSHILGARSRGTEAAETVVQNGDYLLRLDALGFDGTDYEIAAQIDVVSAGTPGNNDMPGAIRMLTTPDGSATPILAMTISQDQSVTLTGALDTALTTSGPVITDNNGVLSSEANLAISRGGTGAGTKAAAFDALHPMTATGDMIYSSSGSTAARLPIGSSGQVIKSVGGVPTWATFSGGINYLSSNPDAEADTTGWSTYADAAGSSPVDGTGGSPTLTWTRSTSSPLRGTASFLVTKDAANRQGEGVGYAFTIDSADQGKVLQISFDYKVASGTYADSDLTVYIYDVTNAQVIQPAGFSIVNAGVSMKQSATFQTASNSTSYRLIIHVASTSASAYTVQFDNFSVGPQIVTNGAAIGDRKAYTPVFTGFGTVSNIEVFWKKEGEDILIEGKFISGTTTGVEARISLPSGIVSADTSKIPTIMLAGDAARNDGSVPASGVYRTLIEPSTSYITFGQEGSGGSLAAKIAGTNFPNAYYVFFRARFPVHGWSSNVQMSSDTDTRVLSLSVKKTSGSHTNTGNAQDVTSWDAVIQDSHGSFNTTTGVYTVSVPGVYEASGQVSFSANSTGIRYAQVVQSGSASVTFAGMQTVGSATIAGTSPFFGQFNCKAGDTIKVQGFQSSGGNLTYDGNTHLFIKRLSGPSQIAATENILAKATNTAGTSIPNTGENLVPFATELKDSHGSWSTDTFTVQSPGDYEVSAVVQYQSSLYAAGNYLTLIVYKNGVANTYGPVSLVSAAVTQIVGSSVNTVLENLVAGDTIKIYATNSRTAGATLLSTSAGVNTVSIKRVKD